MVKDIIAHIVSIYYDSFGDIIVIIITWGCIKKLHTNLQVTLIKDYQVSLFCVCYFVGEWKFLLIIKTFHALCTPFAALILRVIGTTKDSKNSP